MRFAAEPAHAHDRPERTGILLVNLGTPDAPTPTAVRRYLAEFLSDPRVVEIPRALWWPILHGVVLRTRPAKSAAKYAVDLVRTKARRWRCGRASRRSACSGYARRARPRSAGAARRCATASRRSPVALDALKEQGATRVLVLPLYPQYAAATTGSAVDAVLRVGARARARARAALGEPVSRRPRHIDALAARVQEHWMREGRGRMLRDELPRRAGALAGARRPVPLPMPEDRAPAGRAARPGRHRIPGHVPEPLRPRALARALHRARRCASWRGKATSAST